MNNKGKASISTAIPAKVPRLGSGGSNTEDEMVTWLQYPLEGTLERGYCSELFGRSSLTSFGKAKADARKAVPNIRENDSSSTTRTENNEDELALGAGRASGFVTSEGAEAFNKVKTRMQQASCPAQFRASDGNGSSHPVQCSSLQTKGETLKLHSSLVYQGCSPTNPFPENHHAYHGAHDLHNMWLPALPASAQQSLQRTQFSNHAAALSSVRDSSDVLHSLTSRAGSDAWAQEMNPRGSSYGHVGEEHVSLYAVSGGQMVPNWTYSHDAGTPTGAGTALEEGHGTEISGDMFVEGIDVPSCSRGSRSSAELSVKETSSVGKQKVDDFDCQSKNAECDLVAELSQPHKSLPKRSRAAESHNLSEKRRRNRINERLRTLQELIPNSTKTDKASILDEAIEYLKALQSQLQMMSSRSGVRLSPMSIPNGMQHLQMAQMAPVHHVGIGLPYMHAGVGLGMGVMDLSHGVDGRTFQALPAVPPHCGLMYPMAAAVSPQASRGQSYPTGMDAPSSHLRAMEQQASAQPVHVEPQAGSSVEMHQQEEQLVSSRDSKDS